MKGGTRLHRRLTSRLAPALVPPTGLTLDHCTAHETGLEIAPGLSLPMLQSHVETVIRVRGWSAWALGDLLAYARRHHGEPDWDWLVPATGLGKRYLKLQMWGAEKYTLPERHPGLSITHHLRIAHLAPKRRARLLDLAADGRWTIERLALEAGLSANRNATCTRCLMTEAEILACRKSHEGPKRGRKRRT